MKTIEELKQFYDSSLISDLQVLEAERKKVATKAIILNLFCGISLGISIILFSIISFFAFIPLFISVILWSIIYNKITKSYVSDFKTSVIGRIIKFIDENLNYSPAQRISQDAYMESKLFKISPDRYSGDDLVSGKMDKTELMFSEIHSEYKTETRTKNGTQTHWHTIFKGLFVIADFNKNFKGETYVLPDLAQKMFGNVLGNLFQSWNKGRGELIKMEDLDFEKNFVVYGSDQTLPLDVQVQDNLRKNAAYLHEPLSADSLSL